MTRVGLDWLQIAVTPLALATGTIQAAELEQIAARQAQAPDGGLDAGTLAELSSTGWLRQDAQVRGSYLSTFGLRERLDHPELVMLNVPSAATEWAGATLNAMAGYLDESGTRFEPGDVFVAAGSHADEPFTFDRLGAGAADSVGFPADREVLVVIPLP